MSFPLLLQQQGVQLRSWHYRLKSTRLVCHSCLFGSRPFHLQHTNTSVLLITSSTNGRRRTLGTQYGWNLIQQQSPLSSFPLSQQRQVHIMASEQDARLKELIQLLSQIRLNSSAIHAATRRENRRRLSTLYESIRHDTSVWNRLESHQLMKLYAILRPSLHDPSLYKLITNAQHVLLDIQQRTPTRFGMVHVEALLSTYKAKGQAQEAVDLIKWVNNSTCLQLSPKAYEWLIATLTTTKSSHHEWKGDQSPMVLAAHYWDETKVTGTTREQIVGYMMQGYLAQGDLLKAASWLTTYNCNDKTAKVLEYWKTACSGDQHYYAIGVVSYGLERLIQQAAANDRYYDARHFYRQQCDLFNNKQPSPSLPLQHQSTVGLIRLVDRCIATNQSAMLQRLLDDTLEIGHQKGVEVVANRLLNYYSNKNKLRQAFDLYYQLDSLPSHTTTLANTIYDKRQLRSLLLYAAKSKYSTDMHRLYQRYNTLYPSSLDLRAYTHILQTLIRTKQYDQARDMYQDILTHANSLLGSATTTEHTKRLFHLVYSLCAQTGDLTLYKSVVALQHQVGFPVLQHQALTSLMATYVTRKEQGSAKTVFEHLAHHHHPPQPLVSTNDTVDDDTQTATIQVEDDGVEASSVDVVDFNLLMRTVGLEPNEGQGDGQPVTHQILDILRHMSLVGVPSNATTLRTLLDIYSKEDDNMEDQIFKTLLKDPHATRHDHIWLNNLKLTRLLKDGTESTQGKASAAVNAARIFLSDQRHNLFPLASDNEPIVADGMTYKLLLDALTKQGRTASMAQRVFDHMRSRGWRPSIEGYEQMISVWARKQRIQHVKAVMEVACRDLGRTQAPAKWYILVLDQWIKSRSNLVNSWVQEIKKNQNVLADPVLAKRLVKYGLDPFSSSAHSPQQGHQSQH